MKFEAVLRSRFGQFLAGRSRRHRTLYEAVDQLRSCGYPAFLFGGVLRDLVLSQSPRIFPRDLDVVVESVDERALNSWIARYIKRRTRFGGYHLNVEGWKFDLWPLDQTWAFREHLVLDPSFENLPKTTFFNVEAIVARMDTQKFEPRQIYSHGFFEGIAERTLEINLEENPFPQLCVLRALILAARLNFAIGPSLGRYLAHHCAKLSPEELFQIQWSHYKRVIYEVEDFAAWMKFIVAKANVFSDSTFHLPLRPEQLDFWPNLYWFRRKWRNQAAAKRWVVWRRAEMNRRRRNVKNFKHQRANSSVR